jgi:hypothetical protein
MNELENSSTQVLKDAATRISARARWFFLSSRVLECLAITIAF